LVVANTHRLLIRLGLSEAYSRLLPSLNTVNTLGPIGPVGMGMRGF